MEGAEQSQRAPKPGGHGSVAPFLLPTPLLSSTSAEMLRQAEGTFAVAEITITARSPEVLRRCALV